MIMFYLHFQRQTSTVIEQFQMMQANAMLDFWRVPVIRFRVIQEKSWGENIATSPNIKKYGPGNTNSIQG